jgi:hypothetical protein
MTVPDNPITNAQREILRVASHHEKISQSRLAASPTTLDILLAHCLLEYIPVRYSEPYYRITDAGREAIKQQLS